MDAETTDTGSLESALRQARLERDQALAELSRVRAEAGKEHALNEALLAQSAALRRAEAERKRFWDLAFDLMVIVDGPAGRFREVNPAWVHLLGWTEEELTTQPFADFIHPEDRDRTQDAVTEIVGGQPIMHFENRYLTKDGGFREIEWRGAPSDGCFYAYGRDITERKAKEAELNRQRELTARIITHAPTGLSYLNRELIYEWINPKQAEVFGIAIEHIIGRSVYQVLGPETEAQLGAIFKGVLAGEPYYGLGFPFKYTFDGRDAWSYWDFTYQPVPGDDGEPAGVLILANEVSERVEQERLLAEKITQLEAADRYKDEFLSVISHELRTPLNFITGFASTLEDGVHGPLTPSQAGAVAKILAGSDRMLGIVNDLLDYARMRAGKFQLTLEPTAFEPLVVEVVAALRPMALEQGVAIEVAVAAPEALPMDGQRIVQVLTNLIGNALKFTHRGGRIDVAATVQDGRLLCEVTDDGCGIAPEDLPKLFARFSQLDMSSTRKAGGTGLGLAITKALVEAHGGTAGVRSEGVGHGATFWFVLPGEPGESQAPVARVSATPPARRQDTQP